MVWLSLGQMSQAFATCATCIAVASVLYFYRSQSKLSEVVAIIVPGGGLTLECKPTAWVRRRLEEAAKIYKTRTSAGETCVIVVLSGGTPHKPMPIDPESGFQVYEAEGNARSLIHDFGVDASDIFEENWSLDTIANAYMLRTSHTDVAGWRSLVIVNNEFHMRRTQAIFEEVFRLPPLPAAGSYDLSFVTVPNEGLAGEVLTARKQREAKSLEGFKKTMAAIKTLPEMHRFLFSEHMAYSSKRLHKKREPVDPKALTTY